MAINMEEQFSKLKERINGFERYYIGANREYIGPIQPVSIITYSSGTFEINALVLAERVPAMYYGFLLKTTQIPENHLEAVVVYLNDEFEFRHYGDKELSGLSVLIGDKDYSYDGTVAGAAEFFRNKDWNLTVLYEHGDAGAVI